MIMKYAEVLLTISEDAGDQPLREDLTLISSSRFLFKGS